MIVASACLSVIAAGFQLYTSYRSDVSRVMTQLTVIETGFLAGLENALWDSNFKQADALVDGIYAQPDVIQIELVSNTGHTYRLGEPPSVPSVERAFELMHAGEAVQVGTLRVVLSLGEIQHRLFPQFLTLLLSNFAIILAVSIVMLLIFDRIVARHLRSIGDHLNRNDWSTAKAELKLDRKRYNRKDELDLIVAALNQSQAHNTAANSEVLLVRNRLEAVLSAATSGIVALDLSGRVAMINPQARHMLGGLDHEVPFDWPAGIQFLDQEEMHPLDASSNPVNRILVGQTLRGEVSILSRKDGIDPRYVRLSSAQLDPDTSQGIAVVVVLDDVSEQERNRQQIERASRLDALGQLTGGIAHDFNNLLATVQYSVQLAMDKQTDGKASNYLRMALNSIQRGADLTHRLLSFAKRQPGLATSGYVPDVMKEFEQFASLAIEEQIELTFHLDEPEIWVFCDLSQLENALLNLVLNSRDAILRSGHGNKISVRVRGVAEIDTDAVLQRENPHSYIASGLHTNHTEMRAAADGKAYRYVEFSVTDNGPGMTEEVKKRAIDPFFSTKSSNSGTGLGLSMAYGFIKQSNGEMRLYSKPGAGTTVRLLLPRGTTIGQREVPVDRLPVASGKGQNILIVEDEPDLLTMMAEVIQSFGYQVTRAASGPEALELVAQGAHVDLVLTDIVMPGGIGGFKLAAKVRELRPDLPIVYMSGYTGFSSDEMGPIVAPLIQKPSPPGELAEVLRKALSGGK